MSKEMHEQTIAVWRAIAAAGPLGISSISLYDGFRNRIDREVLSPKLQNLLRGAYIAHKGLNRWGQWLITRDCKAPEGEVMPQWVYESQDDNSHTYAITAGKAEVKLPAAPASVFNQPACLDWRPPVAEEEELVAVASVTQEQLVEHEEEAGFLCALYSDGVLWLQADGKQFHLPLLYTRQLLHYLDHMRAAELVHGLAEATS